MGSAGVHKIYKEYLWAPRGSIRVFGVVNS